MGLETVTYISDLVSTNPVAGDYVSAGDDHIRRMKTALLNTFPNITAAITATHTELNKLAGMTATTAELNKLAGVTATVAELNRLAGVTATTAELNKLAGVTATTAELNKLAGVTATPTEFNILAGVTATPTELNLLAGETELFTASAATLAAAGFIRFTNGLQLEWGSGTYADGASVSFGEGFATACWHVFAIPYGESYANQPLATSSYSTSGFRLDHTTTSLPIRWLAIGN